MAVNKIDYEVLQNAIGVYSTQAGNLDDLLKVLNNMNAELEVSWTNETAAAFLQMFRDVHAVALADASKALLDISDYITRYMAAIQENDTANAGNIGIG